MGEAKRRRNAGANPRTGADCLSIRLSDTSGKWALDLDLPGHRHRLTVYYERSDTEANMPIAAAVFGHFTAKQLQDPDIWATALQAFLVACQEAGYAQDDDEPIAVWKPGLDGWIVCDTTRQARRSAAALMREHGCLSDRAWNHIVPPRNTPT